MTFQNRSKSKFLEKIQPKQIDQKQELSFFIFLLTFLKITSIICIYTYDTEIRN